MIVTTWNVRGFTAAKGEMAAELTRSSDLTCLTETWRHIEDSEDWNAVNCTAKTEFGEPRRAGGVAILHTESRPFRHIGSYSDKYFQLIHGTINGVPILAAYVTPCTPPQNFRKFLAIASRCLQGPGVLLGDLNARHQAWDDARNTQGTQLHRWAQRHNFLTHRPPEPTFRTQRGTSRVDIILHRGPAPPSIQVGDAVLGTDHRPVTAHISLSTPSTIQSIPLSLISNKTCRERARKEYKESIPPIIDAIKASHTESSLNINSRRLATATIAPWAAMCRPRSPRFRPGWTIALDNMAKKRKRLLKSPNPKDHERAKDLDKRIKRRFRQNKRHIAAQLADELESANPATECSIIKRALALEGNTEVTPANTDPDKYTSFMESLQPPRETTPLVHVNQFDVPNSFLQTLLLAIHTKLKPKKSPGPDLIRTDLFKLSPSLFANAALELWRAVGRTASIPPLLRSGLLVPIYKGKGDPEEPSNNRPVNLTPAFRRLISTALVLELQKHYKESVEHQWGFQTRTNTECAVTFAVNNLRKRLPYAVLLDLRKAFDCVPRHTLQMMVDQRLPTGLSNMFRPLLWPMRLKTKHQKASRSILTLAGVPQGDPPSPQLFNIFMDSFLTRINTSPTKGIASLFVDDVLLLARAGAEMQQLLNTSISWSDEVGMEWTIHKSCGINLPFTLSLKGDALPNRNHATYLGVSLGPHGVTDDKLRERIQAAHHKLRKLRRITGPWKTTLRQRRLFVKTFVFSLCDYLLFVQPLTQKALQDAAQLEAGCLKYILGMNLTQQQLPRATTLCKLLPIRARRMRHMIKAIAKFSNMAKEDLSTPRQHKNWETISQYATIAPLIKNNQIPDEKSRLEEWTACRLKAIEEEVWNHGNRFRREIPEGPKLPPVYRSSFCESAERMATRWYMNTIPGSRKLSELKEELAAALRKKNLNHLEEQDLELNLLTLKPKRQNWNNRTRSSIHGN